MGGSGPRKEETGEFPGDGEERCLGEAAPIPCKILPRSSASLLLSVPLQENSGEEVLDCEAYSSPATPSPPRGSKEKNREPASGQLCTWCPEAVPGASASRFCALPPRTGQGLLVPGGAFPAARMRPGPHSFLGWACPAQAPNVEAHARSTAAGSVYPVLGSGPEHDWGLLPPAGPAGSIRRERVWVEPGSQKAEF